MMKMKRRNANVPVEEVFKKFIKNCKVKNLSSRTIEYYEETFNIFKNFYDCTNNIANNK